VPDLVLLSTIAGFSAGLKTNAPYLMALSFSAGLFFLVSVCIVKQYSC